VIGVPVNRAAGVTESHLRIAIRRIRKDKLAVAGFIIICLFALVALLDIIPAPYRERGEIRWNRTVIDAVLQKDVER